MAKRKRRYYDSWEAIKSQQHVTVKESGVVRDWDVDEMMLNCRSSKVSKRQRSRIGHIETRKPR